MQAFSILSQEITLSLVTFQLPPLQDQPPIATIDLLEVVDF